MMANCNPCSCSCSCTPCCCQPYINGTTTTSTTTTTTANPSDPECEVVIPAECIIYSGTFLEEYGVNPGDSLADILNLISQFLCICTTTTTSTTTTSTTTTSTTTTSTTSTTTTTTTINPDCTAYYILNLSNNAPQDYQYDNCFGTQISGALDPLECIEVEAIPGSFVLGTGVVSGEGNCPLPLVLRMDDIPLGVTDPFNVSQWNTIFNLPADGTPFIHSTCNISGTYYYLYGATSIAFGSAKDSLTLASGTNLIEIDDQAGCITTTSSLEMISTLTTVDLPNLTVVPDGCFNDCPLLTTITLPACTSLGTTVGNNGVFAGISGNTIALTIPSALMTCNVGNPDGDISALTGANTVTITQV